MRTFFLCFLVLGTLGVALGCLRKANPDSAPLPNQEVVEGNGTITQLDLEGGFFVIRSDDGVTYDPKSLPSDFKTDGLRVRFKVRVVPGAFGIHQVGPIVEVLSIKQLK
jgi:hypothetical protein